MIGISQPQLKRLTAMHGWSAVVLGLLLYAVIATGAVAVFADEIGRWSVGGCGSSRRSRRGSSATGGWRRKVDPAILHDVGAWTGESGDLQVYFHDHTGSIPRPGVEEDFGTMFRAEPARARCSSVTTGSSGASRRPGRRARCGSSSWTCMSRATCRARGA